MEALVKRGDMMLTRPDFIEEGTQGHENISNKDVKPPSLRLAQSTSPETKRAMPAKYIEGLREGELFNSLTREIYGEDPIDIIIVNPLGHRNVEFDKDSKVVEFDVPDDDPRCQFTTGKNDEGKTVRIKPKATKFLDYLILVTLKDGRRKLMTLALKSTQLKKGIDLNSIIRSNTLPCYAYSFKTTVSPESFGTKSWYGYTFVPGWPTPEAYAEAKRWYEEMADKNIIRDDIEEEAAEPVPF